MTTIIRRDLRETVKRAIVAGAAGGVAEIAWVSLYSAVTGGDAAIVARGVTTAAGVSALLPASPVGMGVAVHMLVSVLLGLAAAFVWQAIGRRQGMSAAYVAVLATLAADWAINFLVVLPVISPVFVHLVPYAVSLTSKLLFGLAAAETLRRFAAADEANVPAPARPRRPTE